MKICFYVIDGDDYLVDSLFYGALHNSIYEIHSNTKKSSLFSYKDNAKESEIYGLGFTLYNNIPNIVQSKIKEIDYDETYDVLLMSVQLLEHHLEKIKSIKAKRIILLDGNDEPNIFPFYKKHLKNIKFLNYLYFMRNKDYYKRELIPDYSILFSLLLNLNILKVRLKTISFGIPKQKILIGRTSLKTKDFPEHIVDTELAQIIQKSTKYAFDNEGQYYNDLQNSKFGITTKRAGWDCMRHYEIAANGAVICFKHLNQKPISCAPHGLTHMKNCISYSSADELFLILQSLSEEQYLKIRANGFKWVEDNTSEKLIDSVIAKNS